MKTEAQLQDGDCDMPALPRAPAPTRQEPVSTRALPAKLSFSALCFSLSPWQWVPGGEQGGLGTWLQR